MFVISVITKDRYDSLRCCIDSISYSDGYKLLINASEKRISSDVFDAVFHNNTDKKQVVYNKNMAIRFFLKTDARYLFIIEDDMKILDKDVFYEYISACEKYGIPHMNFIKPDDKEIVYGYNNDIKICERVQGGFQFYRRDCLEAVGTMDENLNGNCWEHIEHTYRIHKHFNYDPEFWHFPDLSYSDELIRYQRVPSSIGNVEQEKYFSYMCGKHGWGNSLPQLKTKRIKIGGK